MSVYPLVPTVPPIIVVAGLSYSHKLAPMTPLLSVVIKNRHAPWLDIDIDVYVLPVVLQARRSVESSSEVSAELLPIVDIAFPHPKRRGSIPEVGDRDIRDNPRSLK